MIVLRCIECNLFFHGDETSGDICPDCLEYMARRDAPPKPKPTKREWRHTPKAKAKQAEYQKAYYRRQKAKRLEAAV